MSDCILWTRGKRKGYGVKWLSKRNWMSAHRWTYIQAYGPVPDDVVIHHVCENKACVNVEHLSAIPRRDHILLHRINDMGAETHRRKTHCPKGHPYDLNLPGQRGCRRCRAEAARRWRERNGSRQ